MYLRLNFKTMQWGWEGDLVIQIKKGGHILFLVQILLMLVLVCTLSTEGINEF